MRVEIISIPDCLNSVEAEKRIRVAWEGKGYVAVPAAENLIVDIRQQCETGG